jgi:hypothetical protein
MLVAVPTYEMNPGGLRQPCRSGHGSRGMSWVVVPLMVTAVDVPQVNPPYHWSG